MVQPIIRKLFKCQHTLRTNKIVLSTRNLGFSNKRSKLRSMAPAAVAIFLISLFVESFSAPNRCVDCQTWESHSGYQRGSSWSSQDDLSQRSANLEDLTQQAVTELTRSPSQLAFDNARPGNWTDVNQYRTPDGNGRVFEEQGQRVDGNRRIRFFKKNFTSSYTNGHLGNFGETDLSRIYGRRDGSQSSHQETDQTQNSAFDQTAMRTNSHTLQDSLQSTERFSGRNEAGYYQNHENSNRLGQHTSVFNGQSGQQGLTTLDQTRPANWSTTNSYRINGGNGRVHEEEGQFVTGPRQVRYYRKNFTSSYSSGGAIPTIDQAIDGTTNFAREVEQQQQRLLDSYGREIHQNTQGSINGGYTRDNSGYYTQPGQTVRQTTYRYVTKPSIYESQSPNTLGSNSHQSYEHTSNFENQHVSQSGGSSVRETEEERRRNQNYGSSTGNYGNTNGYDTQRTERITVLQPTRTRLPYLESQTRQSPYDRLSQSEQAEYRRTYGSQTLHQTGISNGDINNHERSYNTGSYGTGIPSGQMQHYEQFQSSSSRHHPDLDLRRVQSGSNQETQRTINTHNNFDQSTSNNYDSTWGVQNGRLVTQGIDLGQIAQDADCADGTSGHSSYQQSYNHRIYRRDPNTRDVTQQVEDLTQQTEDLTQQSEDLTQQTQDLTQQTEDLTQQTQDFGQQSSWTPGKLEIESQRVHDLTQQTEDLTQQTQDFGQQTEDLTQQTEDLTQQTQDFGQQSSWRPGKLEVESQRVHDLTQQTEDLTQQTQDFGQQTQDLTQQTEDLTQQTQDFAQQSSWRPGKLEAESQRVHDLTQQTEDLTQQTQDFGQQTEDLTQQTEDLTQQTEDLTQQTQDFAQQSSWRPGKLEVESQRVHDLTQQTEDLTQQTQDLGQQTEDLTQQTEDLTQQTQDFGQQSSWRPGKLEVESQRVHDLTQQTEDLTQQTQDFGQQTQDLTQQTEDLTQQTQDFAQQSSWRPGKLEAESQRVHDLTQQTEDLTQQTQDFGQQTEDLTQQTEDLTQQTEDLTQQTQDFAQQSSWRPGKLEVESQRVHDLTQQTEDLTQQTQDLGQQTEDLTQQTEDLTQQTEDLTQQTQDFAQQSSWKPGKLEVESQRVHDLTQQTEDLTQQTQDLTQQTQDLTQQTEDLTQQTQDFGQQSSWRPGKLEVESQRVHDLTQQTEDLTQQTQDFGQQTEDLTQQTEDLTQQTQDFGQQSSWRPGKLEVESQRVHDLTQQTEDLTQQTQDLSQQTEDLTQQTEDLTQQTQDFAQQSSWRPGKLEVESQRVHDLTQQTEDLTQQTQDFGQQIEDLTQQTEDLTQQTEDLTQQTQDFGQQSSWRPGKLEVESQRVHDLTQQTEDLTQQTQDLGQQTEDLTQQTEDLSQQTGNTDAWGEQITSNSGFGQESSWNSHDLEIGSQQTEDLTQQTEDLGQQTEELSQQTGNTNAWGEQITSNSGFGQESSWNSHELEIASQQTEDINQGIQFGHEQTSVQPGRLTGLTPKPAPKPKRPKPGNSHPIQHLNIEFERTTPSNADSHTSEHNDQRNGPLTPQRGDQGIDSNSNESEERDIQIESEIPKVLEQQSEHVSTYPNSYNQQTTSENQFRQPLPTKTKTGRRRGNPGALYQGPTQWDSPRHYPTITGQVTQDFQQHLTNTEGSQRFESRQRQSDEIVFPDSREPSTNSKEKLQLEPVQVPKRAQPLGASIEARQQRSGQSDSIVFPDNDRIEPRILGAWGARGPYEEARDLDPFESIKPNTNSIYTTPPDKDAWDIRVNNPRLMTTTPPPTTTREPTPPPTTTEPTGPPTSPPTTPAPGFWRRVGSSLTNTFEKAKEKAKDLFG